MKQQSFALALAASAVLVATGAQAAVIVVNPSTAFDPPGTVLLRDNDVDGVGDNVSGNPEGFPAFGSFDGNFNAAAGFSFVLPILPEGETIQSVTFRAFVDGAGANVPGGKDLYGIRKDPSGAFLVSDYGIGATQSGSLLGNDLTLNQGQYLDPVDVTSFVASGYAAGDTVFFRISTDATTVDVDTAGARGFFLGANQASKPELIITTAVVPEPSSIALLALTTVGLTMIRRRRLS